MLSSLSSISPAKSTFATRTLAHHWLDSSLDLSLEQGQLYSRMKYGDPASTRQIAREMMALLVRELGEDLGTWMQEGLVLASSAYGCIPTAAHWVMEEMRVALAQMGRAPEQVQFLREGGFGCHNYSKMDFQQRREVLHQRRIRLSRPERLQGKRLLVFDDLRSTGAHEDMLLEVLEESAAPQEVCFLYWIGFNPQLAVLQPQQEDLLNHSEIRALEDVIRLIRQSPEPLRLNARLVKFVLRGGPGSAPAISWPWEQFPRGFLQALASAAASGDGYAELPAYRAGYQNLMAFLESDSR